MLRAYTKVRGVSIGMSITSRKQRIVEDKALREHLIMMLTALGYPGAVTRMNNDELREKVEEYKILFLRRLQDAPP